MKLNLHKVAFQNIYQTRCYCCKSVINNDLLQFFQQHFGKTTIFSDIVNSRLWKKISCSTLQILCIFIYFSTPNIVLSLEILAYFNIII